MFILLLHELQVNYKYEKEKYFWDEPSVKFQTLNTYDYVTQKYTKSLYFLEGGAGPNNRHGIWVKQ